MVLLNLISECETIVKGISCKTTQAPLRKNILFFSHYYLDVLLYNNQTTYFYNTYYKNYLGLAISEKHQKKEEFIKIKKDLINTISQLREDYKTTLNIHSIALKLYLKRTHIIETKLIWGHIANKKVYAVRPTDDIYNLICYLENKLISLTSNINYISRELKRLKKQQSLNSDFKSYNVSLYDLEKAVIGVLTENSKRCLYFYLISLRKEKAGKYKKIYLDSEKIGYLVKNKYANKFKAYLQVSNLSELLKHPCFIDISESAKQHARKKVLKDLGLDSLA
jgi:hypothetical protein